VKGEKAWLILTDMTGKETARTCVDVSDLLAVRAHRWSLRDQSSEYVTSNSAPGRYLHRFLLDPEDGEEVDHWDGDTLNNCRVNLKVVGKEGNRQNIRRGEMRGVYCQARKKGQDKWRGQVGSGGKTHYTVLCATPEEAVAAVRSLRSRLLAHVNEDRH
jgi:hypothetical protein